MRQASPLRGWTTVTAVPAVRQGAPVARTLPVHPELPVAPATTVSVIVPTRNEAANVDPLVDRLARALAGVPAEVIFVDDSDDETPQAVLNRSARGATAMRVVLLHRAAGERAGGLGTAVASGLSRARGEWVVVMDGDLQHPPEMVPRLLQAGEAHGVDMVVASRHAEGGDDSGLSGLSRTLVSQTATRLADLVFSRALRGVSDPMSGFFAVRREAVDTTALQPDGFKILMEILVRHPGMSRTELGFVFEERVAGQSKASVAEGMRFLRHVTGLSRARLTDRWPRTSRALGFGVVGATGIVVNTLALWLLADPSLLGLNLVVAVIAATQVSTTWNFLLVDRLVYQGRKARRQWHRYLLFSATNNVVLLARVPVLALLVAIGTNYLVANAITLVLSFVLRFATSDRFIYRSDNS